MGNLPNDVARCPGTTAPLCQQCKRKGQSESNRIGPEIVGSSCRNFIPVVRV